MPTRGELTHRAGWRFTSFDVGGARAPDALVRAESLRSPGKTASSRARALLDLTGGTTLRNTSVDMTGRGEHVTANASLVAFTSTGARANDILIDGLGAPLRATFETSPGAVMVKARTRGLELARVAHAAGLQVRVGGRVAFDVDTELRWNGAQGRVALDVTDGAIDGWEGAKAHVEATLQGRLVTGQATASLADIASIELKTKNVEIGGGGPLEPGWWRHTWGEVDVASHVDLAKLEAKLPASPGAKPSDKISGVLDLKARLGRDSATDETPRIDLQASTKGLLLTGGDTAAPWRLDGVDAAVDLKVDGQTGHTTLDAQLTDPTGLLADFNLASGAIPYRRLFLTGDDLFDIAQGTSFTANFTVPERDIRVAPGCRSPGRRSIHREAQCRPAVEWYAPSTDAVGHGEPHARPDGREDARHADRPRYGRSVRRRAGATLTLGAQAHARQVLDAQADIDAKASDLLAAASGAALPWKAAARATLDAFPLQSIGALDDHQVRGQVSGDLSLDGLHDDAKAHVALKLDGLHVGDVSCKSAEAQASVDGSALDATIGLDQGDGSVSLHAHTGSRWGSAMAPTLDATRAADVSLVAKGFRAELLQPFLTSVFAQLDGRIDADAHLSVGPGSPAPPDSSQSPASPAPPENSGSQGARTVRSQGTIALRDGTFEMTSFGGEFHDVGAKIVLTPDGIVRLENATMHGLSGRVQAAATARLDGLSLEAARAEIQVPKNDPLPLVLDGVQAGTIDGHLALSVDRTPDKSALDIGVNVPELHVQLPTSSSHDVQTLGNLEGVRVGVERSGEFVALQLDGDGTVPDKKHSKSTPMKVAVKLGNDVADRARERPRCAPLGHADDHDRRRRETSGQVRLTRGRRSTSRASRSRSRTGR